MQYLTRESGKYTGSGGLMQLLRKTSCALFAAVATVSNCFIRANTDKVSNLMTETIRGSDESYFTGSHW